MNHSSKDLTGKVVVFFDGDCGFCNSFILWIAKQDANDHFRFIPNDRVNDYSPVYISPEVAASSIVVLWENNTYLKSRAIKTILKFLPQRQGLYNVLRVFNDKLLDLGYGLFSRIRYAFGKNSCTLPAPNIRAKFL